MANGTTDNTAVNRLIDLAQQRPVEADDTLFESPKRIPLPPPFRARGASSTMPPPLPRKRAPAATRTDLHAAAPAAPVAAPAPVAPAPVAPAPVAPAPVIATAPPVVPAPRASASVAVPSAESWELSEHDVPTRPFDQVDADALDDDAPVAAAPPAPVSLAPAVAPIAARPAPAAPMPRLPAAPVPPPASLDQTPSVEARFWADSDDSDDSVDVAIDEPAPIAVRATRRYAPRATRHDSTQIARMPRRANRSWLWIGGAFVLGVAATAIIAWPRGNAPTAAPPPAVAAPTAPAPTAVPAPAPAVAPIVTPTAAPTVAPIAVAPAPTVAPIAQPVAPEPAPEPVAAEPAPEPVAAAPVRPTRTRTAAPPAPRVASKPAPTRVASKPAPAPTGGAALLMIGSKPPCDIVVDGKRTGLTTPQRALKLTPGPHKVTLVNKQYGINESFTVTAKVGAPVKVVKDLTAKMRR